MKKGKKFHIYNLDYTQIKIFIKLEIIEEEKLYIFFKYKNLKKFLQFGKAIWRLVENNIYRFT